MPYPYARAEYARSLAEYGAPDRLTAIGAGDSKRPAPGAIGEVIHAGQD